MQRFVRPAKVGHAGTLDPLATGLLVVCLGHATRLIKYVQQLPKEYRATFLLGRTSPSDDTETEVTELISPTTPTLLQIEAAASQFVGRIDQVPPEYSAVKIHGARAYQLARRGEQFTITPREVQIHQIQILAYQYPRLELLIQCGSGTYVRSIGRDLAEHLGTGAVMSALTRTRIGRFDLQNALLVTEISLDQIVDRLQPAAMAVKHLPRITVNAEIIDELRFGRTISGSTDHECAAFDEQGNLVAVLTEMSPGVLKPHINFAPSA